MTTALAVLGGSFVGAGIVNLGVGVATRSRDLIVYSLVIIMVGVAAACGALAREGLE